MACIQCGSPVATIRHKYCQVCLHARRKRQWIEVKERIREMKKCPDCGGKVPKGKHYCQACGELRAATHARRTQKPFGYVMVPCGVLGSVCGVKIDEAVMDEEPCAIVRLVTTKAEVAVPIRDCVPITTAQLLKLAR